MKRKKGDEDQEPGPSNAEPPATKAPARKREPAAKKAPSTVSIVDEQELLRSLHHSAILTAKDVTDAIKEDSNIVAKFDPEVVLRVTSILFDAVTASWGPDAFTFSDHAKRTTVGAEDVKLLTRRNPGLAADLEAHYGPVAEPGKRKSMKGPNLLLSPKLGLVISEDATMDGAASIASFDAPPSPAPHQPIARTPAPTSKPRAFVGFTPQPPQAQSTPLRATPLGGRHLPPIRLPSPIAENVSQESIILLDTPPPGPSASPAPRNLTAASTCTSGPDSKDLEWQREQALNSLARIEEEQDSRPPSAQPELRDSFDDSFETKPPGPVPKANRSSLNGALPSKTIVKPSAPAPFSTSRHELFSRSRLDETELNATGALRFLGYHDTPSKASNTSCLQSEAPGKARPSTSKGFTFDSFDEDDEPGPASAAPPAPAVRTSYDSWDDDEEFQLLPRSIPQKLKMLKEPAKPNNPFKKNPAKTATPAKSQATVAPKRRSDCDLYDSFDDDDDFMPKSTQKMTNRVPSRTPAKNGPTAWTNTRPENDKPGTSSSRPQNLAKGRFRQSFFDDSFDASFGESPAAEKDKAIPDTPKSRNDSSSRSKHGSALRPVNEVAEADAAPAPAKRVSKLQNFSSFDFFADD